MSLGRTRRLASEAGSSTTELVLLMPVVLLLVMLIVQFGLWLHARQVATAAAQEGLSAVQRVAGSEADGQERIDAFLAEAGGLRDVAVTIVREIESASVEVRGSTPAVVPGMHLGVTIAVQGPVERFVPEPER